VKEGRGLFFLALFAVSMAYLEAAVVVYLRRLYYPENLLSLFPLKFWEPSDLALEMGREAATLVMLLAVAALAVRGKARVFAAFAFLFGAWDLMYYFWLKALLRWPVGWLEWDILFLIPWAWLGPWPAPALVALILCLWGGWITGTGRSPRFGPAAATLSTAGVALLLAAFLLPAFPLLSGGPEALAAFVPAVFPWGYYAAGAALLSAGLLMTLAAEGKGTAW